MELNNNSTKLDRKNDDLISRQAALDDAHRQIWYRMNQQSMRDRIDDWLKSLPSAQPEPKTADSGSKPHENAEKVSDRTTDGLISRQAAIDALRKALYEYEDETEKRFQESDELDVGDWMLHRIFVQNMSDIDKQTILNLPSAQPELPEWAQTVERWYNKALSKSYIQKPMAWALYQTWKEHDNG